MEAFLGALLPRILPRGCTFATYPFLGKPDLFSKLEARLRAYSKWLPPDSRIVVLVDRDDDDCHELKRKLDRIATRAGLRTRSGARDARWQVVNRIAIEELESWYFGDWLAVRAAYPESAAGIPRRQGFRDPDAISGGTSEAFERVMQDKGYFRSGLRKIEAARAIGAHVSLERSTSASFRTFASAILEP